MNKSIDEQFKEMRQEIKPLTLKEKIDYIYNLVDKEFSEQKYHNIDVWLKVVNIRKRSVDELLAILTVTLPAKSSLTNRIQFLAEVESEIRRRGEWENNLLDGLE